MGGKTCLYNHFRGAKALFCFINLQVNNSVWGQSHAKFFIRGDIAPCPNRYVLAPYPTFDLISNRT